MSSLRYTRLLLLLLLLLLLASHQAVVWFYLSWIDGRVKGQIEENAAKLANETANYKCDSPCQSNQKAVAGGCCDGESTSCFLSMGWGKFQLSINNVYSVV
jgi:hypothetical protein